MKSNLLLIVLVLGRLVLPAQTSTGKPYPVTGETMPSFTLNNVMYYARQTVTPETFRGKWLIIDFWSKGCLACVKSFPKVNQLQQEFSNDIQFLLVGINHASQNKGIEQDYEVYRKRLNLTLPIAFDSILYRQFGLTGVPYVLVIDPAGKVYAQTYSDFFTRDKLQALIDQKQPVYNRYYTEHETRPETAGRVWEYSLKDRPDEVLTRSVLSRYTGNARTGGCTLEGKQYAGVFGAVGMTLSQLYNTAYWGICSWGIYSPQYITHWRAPLLEMKDTTAFIVDFASNAGLYNYSLIVPAAKDSLGARKATMQADLQRVFGYKAVVETRMMPCWKLTATAAAKQRLASRGPEHSFEASPSKYSCTGYPVAMLLHDIDYYRSDYDYPLIDETGITGNIDIRYTAAKTDFEDVRQALAKEGLLFELVRKPMKVLVIRD